jgi:hypothetical protein
LSWNNVTKPDGSKVVDFTFDDCASYDAKTLEKLADDTLAGYRVQFQVSADNGELIEISNLSEIVGFHLRQATGVTDLSALSNSDEGAQLRITLEQTAEDEVRSLPHASYVRL